MLFKISIKTELTILDAKNEENFQMNINTQTKSKEKCCKTLFVSTLSTRNGDT